MWFGYITYSQTHLCSFGAVGVVLFAKMCFFLSAAQLADKTIAAGLGVDNKQNLISMNQKFHFQALRRQVAQKNQA